MTKTNAARLLDKLGISYSLREYQIGKEHIDAIQVAKQIGMKPEQVFKTLLARGDKNGVCMAVIAADAELDLKALARVSGNRKVNLVPVIELQTLTGYIRGGVTALAAKKEYPVYLDESAVECDMISVSAGVKGKQLVLAPKDYIIASHAVLANIAR
ncbi:MAG: Cys-tRNA(Pro) deacylase [Proteobacteria bacterium]|nr:Cys-tRNA(Pro) deacylase [Pseudomonadota bacterium]